MNVIQPGIADMENQMRVKCNTCQAIFDICAEDISKEYCRKYSTICPNPSCKSNIPLYEGIIPTSILWKVDLRETK